MSDDIDLLIEQSKFLIDRLRDLENGWDDEEAYREFCGHIAPAIARLKSTIEFIEGDE